MSKESLWTTKVREREERIRAIRTELIGKLLKNKLGFGPLSGGEVAKILGLDPASVSRIKNTGKNVSRRVASQ